MMPPAKCLIDTAMARKSFEKQYVALKQLLEISKRSPLKREHVQLLIQYVEGRPALSEWGEDVLEVVAARVVANAEVGTDELVMHDYDSLPVVFAVVAIAAAQNPSPAVTAELAKRAAAEETKSPARMFYALALSARGDESADWSGELAYYLNHNSELEELDPAKVQDFLAALLYTAPRLPANQGLLDALWNLTSTKDAAIALVALSCLARKPVDPGRIDNVRKNPLFWDSYPGIPNLLLAGVLVDPHEEVAKALALLGQEFTSEQAFALLLFLNSRVGELVLPEVKEGLSASSPVVRLGALRIAGLMGPEAKALLPRTKKVLRRGDAELRDEVLQWQKFMAGLNSAGEWALEDEAK